MSALRSPPAGFFARRSLLVAPELLGMVLAVGPVRGRIVEVEAYEGTDDAASHASRGPTPRAAIMFGPVRRLYVYRSYGVHWCANVVAHEPGGAGAVLIRAIEPMTGMSTMAERRPAAVRPTDVGSGPGKVCQALAIDGSHLGLDLGARGAAVRLLDDGYGPIDRLAIGPRIGISRAADRPWRFSVPDNPHRSRPW